MSFITKIIPWKHVLVIDIWTYKVKVALCEYKNQEVEVLAYSEKRQEETNIIWSEIWNIEWVSNTIESVISNVLKWQDFNPKDIIINIPTSTLISSTNKIVYSRNSKDNKIDLDELDYIVWKAERKALEDAKRDISKKTWFSDVDMKLITSSITSITIDNFSVSNPIWFTWENVSLSTLNIFIPASRYNIIETISNYLWKNVLSIIPLEFSLPKITENSDFHEEDIIFIDIWNTKSAIIIQRKWVIIGFDRIDIWMNDLIKNIRNNTWKTKIEIIRTIDETWKYIEEKKEFLSVWEEWFAITLKEILKTSVIPHKIFLTWWWDNNFLREHIQNIDLQKYSLHSVKPLTFIEIDYKNFLKIKWNDEIFDKTNIWLLSMIITAKEIINYKKNPVLTLLKEFLEKNEF